MATKQYCKRGHDRTLPGATYDDGSCVKCRELVTAGKKHKNLAKKTNIEEAIDDLNDLLTKATGADPGYTVDPDADQDELSEANPLPSWRARAFVPKSELPSPICPTTAEPVIPPRPINEVLILKQTNINGQLINTVNARDLHEFLEVGRNFSNWIKERIDTFGFTEGQDFITDAKSGVGGQYSAIEYALTPDMAKELSMVERNDKGKEVRHYFIRCEEIAKQPAIAEDTERLDQTFEVGCILVNPTKEIVVIATDVPL
jgi:phage anti-repressor protein